MSIKRCNSVRQFVAIVLFAFISNVVCQERAPQFIDHPNSDNPYKPGEDITLNCQANGAPTPEYYWKRDDDLVIGSSGGRSHLGSLVINEPSQEDDGIYQCFASNKFGTALSRKARVQKAELEPFPTVFEPTVRNPMVGDHLILPCTPPKSYPTGSSYWGFNRPGSNKLEHIETNGRVVMDYEGNLYFANVLMRDSLSSIGDRVNYICIVNNARLGAYVQGNDQKVTPKEIPGSPAYYAPQLLWSSPSPSIAIKGQPKRLKCIFGGLPTPTVIWKGPHDSVPRFETTPEGYGTEIRFPNVDLEDEGIYECSATNVPSGLPVSHRIRLIVQSPPQWRHKPQDIVEADDESDFEVDCSVNGTPKPNVTYYINGRPARESDFQGKMTLDGNRVRFRNVNVNDSHIIACMATNEHGDTLHNFIIKINAEQPSFMETPRDVKVVKGKTAVFNCHARGAPKPKIVWTCGSPPETLSGNRFTVHPSGSLEIQDVGLDDTERYTCNANNKLGHNDASAQLIVRSPTKITSRPVDKVINASDTFFLPCDVTTDPEEETKLKVMWYKNDELIDFKKDTHLYVDKKDFSLRSKNSKVKDTARYKCRADNGLDSADSENSGLTVRDRPDPPYDGDILQCESTNAVISWSAGEDNNDPITEFTIHYKNALSNWNVTVDKPKGGHLAPHVRHQKSVAVRPWSTYTFSVTATNSMGKSDAAEPPANKVCTTEAVAPYRNPNGVCGKLTTNQKQLVIVWEPLPQEEWNGDGFHYIVGYKLHNSKDRFQEQKIRNPEASELDIRDREPFTKYEIYVQSANSKGKAQMRQGDKKITYSGEGKPTVAPQNFRQGDYMNGTYAEFLWEPVDDSHDQIRGFFRGYRIDFWKPDDPKNVRSEDILFDTAFDLCPALDDEDNVGPFRHRRHRLHIRSPSSPVEGSTNQLWPNSKLHAAVQVLNQAQSGPLSNTIEFHTPEGVPGVVSRLSIIESGSTHLRVDWDFPLEPNGVIVGYDLWFSVAHPAVGRRQDRHILDPLQTTYKITDLEYSTKYEVHVAALTAEGQGQPEAVIGETGPNVAPDAPVIGKIEPGVNYANVSWKPSDKEPPENPGSTFRVEYRKGDSGNDTWVVADHDPDRDDNWVNVTNLEPGRYEFVVVAAPGEGDAAKDKETRSKPWFVYIGPDAPPDVVTPVEEGPSKEPLVMTRASSDWFIILMCIIAFLLLILLIVCLLRRSRSDMYPVYEKEKMWRHDPLSPDEAPFGEYAKPMDKQHLGKSQGSLDSEEKPLESDSDSLGEYEDQDASKFNEDGSFIGVYSGKHKEPPKSDTSSRPPITNTFV